jgi:hypothetical protein
LPKAQSQLALEVCWFGGLDLDERDRPVWMSNREVEVAVSGVATQRPRFRIMRFFGRRYKRGSGLVPGASCNRLPTVTVVLSDTTGWRSSDQNSVADQPGVVQNNNATFAETVPETPCHDENCGFARLSHFGAIHNKG